MPILNYYTKVSIDRTIVEIQKILVKHGASKIAIDYENQVPVNVTFATVYKDTIVLFSLPCRFAGILGVCKKQGFSCSSEQARRIGWRTLKDWISSQLSLVEQEMAELPEVFMQYGVTRSGERLYDYIKNLDRNSTPLMLGDGTT